MRVVIGFESMYGNTRRLAEAVAAGFTPDDVVTVVPIAQVDGEDLSSDLLVVGLPTHGHTSPSARSRSTAASSARRSGGSITLDDTATDPGVREWLAQLPDAITAHVAAYDTRFRAPAWLTGHPARRVTRTLVAHGGVAVAPPESFYVDKREHLRAGELYRAHQWGAMLRTRVAVGRRTADVG